MTGRRNVSSSSSVSSGNPGRELTRAELAHVVAHAKLQPSHKRRQVTSWANTPAGRERLRGLGFTKKPTQQPTPPTPQLAGQPVDVDKLLAGLRSTERGRAALRARGLR